jgi:hypothetical protein
MFAHAAPTIPNDGTSSRFAVTLVAAAMPVATG